MDNNIQTIFLLRDKPIIELNPKLLKEHRLSVELFGDTSIDEYEKLKGDIEMRGIQDPLHVVRQSDDTYLLVSGHRRTKAAKELGINVPCIVRTDLKEEWQIREAVIKDNLVRRQLSDYQKVCAGMELEPIEKIKAENREIAAGKEFGVGHPKEEKGGANFPHPIEKRKPRVRDIIAKEVGLGSGKQYEKAKKVYEEAPEPIKKKWQEGKITTHGAFQKMKKKEELEEKEAQKEAQYKEDIHSKGHIVYGDAIDLLDKIENRSFDLLLTDPPYSTDIDNFKGFLEKWVVKAIDKIKDTGRVYIFAGSYVNEISAYIDVLLSLTNGFKLSNILIWHYRNVIGPSPKLEYKRGWQGIFYLYGKDAPPLKSPLVKDLFDHFEISEPDGRHEIKFHSHQKPEELIKNLLVLSTEREDRVLDLFAGSGSIGLTSSKLERYSLSIEKEKDNIEKCIKRGLIAYEFA